MGIVNVTPDSFSDGGDHLDIEAAVAHGEALAGAGAHILDIGGESTRPGALSPSIEEECARAIPVIEALAASGHTVSVDTRHAAVMRAGLEAGATIVNDITALTGDSESLNVIAETKANVILMHMQGKPNTMQDAPTYSDVVAEIVAFLAERIQACQSAGIPRDRIAADPGIGFGKTPDHNLDLIANIRAFAELGVPTAIGVSRKSFISAVAGENTPKNRLAGSLAAGLAALDGGAQILRVHDVRETVQAISVWRAIRDRRRIYSP